MSANFPISDRNRRVKEASKTVFELRKPVNWHAEFFGGDDDFGFDVHVQVDIQGGVQHTFYIQLKGTEHPDWMADESTLRHPLNRSTLNLYANVTGEVMLVVCVVALDSSGRLLLEKSEVYWQWISDILKAQRGSAFELDMSAVKKTTVHVPASQVLTPDLDVSERLQIRIKQLRLAASLEEILHASGGTTSGLDPISALSQWVETLRSKPENLAMLVLGQQDSDFDKLHPEAAAIRALIRAGKTDSAAAALEKAGRDGFGSSPVGQALWLNLSGKIAMQCRRRQEALRLFEAAYTADPCEEYLLALAETKFLAAIDINQHDEIVSIRESLALVKSDDGLALLVRVLVSLSDFKSAQDCIERITPSKQLMPKLVLLSSMREWARVIELASAAEADQTVAEGDRAAIQLVAARAAWLKALETAPSAATAEETPLSGPVGTGHESARVAWDFAIACTEGLRAAGWPPNIELLAPVLCAVAGVIGTQDAAVLILREAADARPEYEEIQHNIELLALGAGNTEVALNANLKQTQTGETLVRRVGLLFQSGRHIECVHSALEVVSGDGISDRNAGLALAMGYASARKIARIGDADMLRTALQGHAESAEFLAFADFAFSSLEKPKSQASLDHLRSGLVSSPDSWLLASNLYSNLDVSDVDQAWEAVSLSKILHRHTLLTRPEAVHEVYALLTLKRWEDAAAAARQALSRFGSDQRLLSLLAVAEEMLGRTGVAFAVLERAMTVGADRVTILHNYMGLALRLGRVECVRQALDKLLALEADRDERMELLRLRTLLHVQEGEYSDAYRIAIEVGRLVNQASEDEEGMFLNLLMAVTIDGPPLDDADARAFSVRVDKFCETWPESRHFRRVQMPIGGLETADDLHRLLDPLVGDSRTRMQEYAQRERQLRHGELPVPYIVRPAYAIHYIGNAFDLWAVAKRSKEEDKQYHLQSVLSVDDLDRHISRRDTPILDLTALLVLDSLDLFDKLFDVFQVVAIPKHTVGYVSQHANSILAGGPGKKSAKSILASINKWIDRIDQPSSGGSSSTVIPPTTVLTDYLSLVKTARWIMYCDDAILRMLMKNEGVDVKGLTTTDLLHHAESIDLILPAEVASFLARLVSWNVVVNVHNRYLLASLDGAIRPNMHGNAAHRLALIEKHEPFTVLFRALTIPGKSSSDLVRHMGELLTDLLGNNPNELDTTSAVVAFWFNRVRMFRVAGELGWRLLGYPVIYALSKLPDSMAGRTISVMRTAIELCMGERGMSAAIDAEIPAVLGDIAGSLAQREKQVGETVRRKLSLALPLRTADGDRCFAAYAERQKRNGDHKAPNSFESGA